MKNKAFTLAELLICFVVVAIISALIITTHKKDTSVAYKYLYKRAYDSLNVALYNGINELGNVSYNTPTDVCRGLTAYINAQVDHYDASGKPVYCRAIDDGDRPSINAGITTIDVTKPDFIANNSMAFYISKQQLKGKTAASPSQFNYYIVYIDINGVNTPPNSIHTIAGVEDADIVPFIVTEDLLTIPVGSPTYHKEELAARVEYPPDDGAGGSHTDYWKSATMSYYEAKIRAFGTVENASNYETVDFNKANLIGSEFVVNSGIPAVTQDAACVPGDCDVIVTSYHFD